MKISYIIAHFCLGPLMFILAFLFNKFPPKVPNHFYGHRTKMSMINKETWNTANKLSSYMFLKISFITCIIQIFGILFNLKFDLAYLFAVTFLIIGMIIGAINVEKKLKSIFDENGNKK